MMNRHLSVCGRWLLGRVSSEDADRVKRVYIVNDRVAGADVALPAEAVLQRRPARARFRHRHDVVLGRTRPLQ